MQQTTLKPLTNCESLAINRQHQSGAVLVTALVLLLVMTLLGLSTMSTSSIEERIASNNQSVNRSFHAADLGLADAFMNGDGLDTTVATQRALSNIGAYSASVAYTVAFRQVSPLGRSADLQEIWGENYGRYHFELQSTGTTTDNVTTQLRGGLVQIGLLPR